MEIRCSDRKLTKKGKLIIIFFTNILSIWNIVVCCHVPVWTSHYLLRKVVVFFCKHGCLFHLGQWESRQDTRSCTLFGQTIINAWGVSISFNIFSVMDRSRCAILMFIHTIICLLVLCSSTTIYRRANEPYTRRFTPGNSNSEQHDGDLTTQRVSMKFAGVTGNWRKKGKLTIIFIPNMFSIWNIVVCCHVPVWTSHYLLRKVVVFFCKHGCLFHLGQWESRQDTRSCTLFGQTIINAWGVSISFNIFSFIYRSSRAILMFTHTIICLLVLYTSTTIYWRANEPGTRRFTPGNSNSEQHDGGLTMQRVLRKFAAVTENSRKKVNWK